LFLRLLGPGLLLADNVFAAAAGAQARHYRAHATILLLSFPVFTRRDVGSGYAAVEQSSSSAQSTTTLQFAGGSNPQRAQGINRIGLIQESITTEGGKLAEIEYFGVMSSSTEENYDQARTALKKAGGAGHYTAAQARITQAHSSSSLHRLVFDQPFDWNRRNEFLDRAKAAVSSNRHCVRRDEGATANRTFLLAMHDAIVSAAQHTSAEYFYNSQRYRLTSKRDRDAGMGEQLKLGGNIDRISGTIQNVATGKKTQFRVWVDRTDHSGLPVRMEYQARSFLRLVFEAAPVTG
jgi:hypothetical protein